MTKRVGSIADAIAFGEVVLLATPWGGTQDAVKAADNWSGKILIDCTNPIGPERSWAVGHTTSGAEEIAQCDWI